MRQIILGGRDEITAVIDEGGCLVINQDGGVIGDGDDIILIKPEDIDAFMEGLTAVILESRKP